MIVLTDEQMSRFWNKVAIRDRNTCWQWMGYCDRYGIFRLNGKMVKAHRVSWTIHFGRIPSGNCILHRCDVPACVNPAHLWLGTQGDNVKDCVQKGRAGGFITWKGERNVGAKLDEHQAREIRRLYQGNIRQIDIANQFGIGQTQVSRIVRSESWKSA